MMEMWSQLNTWPSSLSKCWPPAPSTSIKLRQRLSRRHFLPAQDVDLADETQHHELARHRPASSPLLPCPPMHLVLRVAYKIWQIFISKLTDHVPWHHPPSDFHLYTDARFNVHISFIIMYAAFRYLRGFVKKHLNRTKRQFLLFILWIKLLI